jgi:hypothetical protein
VIGDIEARLDALTSTRLVAIRLAVSTAPKRSRNRGAV